MGGMTSTSRYKPLIKLSLVVLFCASFYLFVREADRITYTEELFLNTDGTLVAAIFFFVIGLFTMGAARNKGREHIGWFVCGTFLAPIPLILVSMLPSKFPKSLIGLKKCRNCGEFLEPDEYFCHCGTSTRRPWSYIKCFTLGCLLTDNVYLESARAARIAAL